MTRQDKPACFLNVQAATNHWAALAQVRRSLDDVIVDSIISKQQCKRSLQTIRLLIMARVFC